MIVMHGNRATSNVLPCTETVHVTSDRHARVGVQHKSPSPCTVAVQLTLHACGATQDNRYRTTDPDMHYVQVGCIPLPDFMTTHLARLNHVGNQQTACAKGGAS